MSINKYVDKQNRFVEIFDNSTGFYVRTGVIENGKDTGVDPFMRTFPSLIDVGIMGHCDSGRLGLCKNAGIQCYQDGLNKSLPNMTLENFKKIVDESKGKVLQIALGGRGNPNKHENFKEIVQYCRANNIVPNYTTSGMELTDEEVALTKKYCGAVAVSWQRAPHTLAAIKKFIDAGCKTNIHYVLGNFSIEEAIWKLDPECYNAFPKGINAVIFLAHKHVGLGSNEQVLRADDPKVKKFFELVDNHKFAFKIGFDSCSMSGIATFTKKIDMASTEGCEGACFSAYISANMIMTPCSFDSEQKWGVNLATSSLKQAWDSENFNDFRECHKRGLKNGRCLNCKHHLSVCKPCPIVPEISLCEGGR